VGSYFRNPNIFVGGPFRCYNCNKLLLTKLSGDQYKIELKCPRCKAYIIIKMNEPASVNELVQKAKDKRDVMADATV